MSSPERTAASTSLSRSSSDPSHQTTSSGRHSFATSLTQFWTAPFRAVVAVVVLIVQILPLSKDGRRTPPGRRAWDLLLRLSHCHSVFNLASLRASGTSAAKTRKRRQGLPVPPSTLWAKATRLPSESTTRTIFSPSLRSEEHTSELQS